MNPSQTNYCIALRYLLLTAPARLHGTGQYGLTNVKEVAVTDSFQGLPMKDRLCQMEEAQETCVTRSYLAHLRLVCGCVPLRLRTDPEVLFTFTQLPVM